MVVGSSVSSLSSSIISNSSMSSSIRSFSSKSLVSSGSISLFVMEVLLSSIKLFGQQFVVVVSFSSTITAVSFVVLEGFGMVLNETSVLLLPSSIFRRSLSVSVASERENDRGVRCKY